MTARRTFSLPEQLGFARLSGDWNPLHIDPVAARRTIFEAPVVHGIHLLMWALDRWLADRAAVSITALKVVFRKRLLLDTEVALEMLDDPDASRGSRVRLVGTAAGDAVLEATIGFTASDPAPPCPELAPAGFTEVPRFVAREAIAALHGRTPLALDTGAATAGFPHAVRALGAVVVAELLALTRIVGMECPGLHSVFGGLELQRSAEPGPLAIDWRVTNANLKYSVVAVAVHGARFEGKLATFYRPAPQDGPTVEQVSRAVRPGEFAGQRALVVGGSRGLGEAIVRCLAAGGADVCLTYHRGAADAERIIADTAGSAGRIVATALDVTTDAAPGQVIDLRWPFDAAPTHLYYLATPRMPTVARFARADLDHMLRFYVDGLFAVTATVCQLGAPIDVWVPSTSLLSDGDGSAAYCMAKAAMEELCRRLPKMMPVRVRTPRLPRIATDQTAGLTQLPAAPALDVALAELRAVAATGH
jgi:NAD(P)-dependent dehydrogenase (short-subunit alcohol dehydrogenase family)